MPVEPAGIFLPNIFMEARKYENLKPSRKLSLRGKLPNTMGYGFCQAA